LIACHFKHQHPAGLGVHIHWVEFQRAVIIGKRLCVISQCPAGFIAVYFFCLLSVGANKASIVEGVVSRMGVSGI